VDDEQHAIDLMLYYAEQVPFIKVVGACTNPLEALRIINEQKIDAVFLDIQMPQMTGVELARMIIGKTNIIFTTAYSEFALDGFEIDALDYLLKPIPMQRFLKAVQRALNSQATHHILEKIEDDIEDDYIFVKTELKGKLLKINLREIDYIEGMKNYVAIYHNQIRTVALLTLRDLEERLPQKYFLRVHKSFIVAVNKITRIERNQVFIKNIKTEILVGTTYKPGLMQVLNLKLMQ
jgi:DNA-binding LytR/AlgR family response regulator